jgi:hypothetical protein
LTTSRSGERPSLGQQEPRICCYPEFVSTLGDEFIELAELAGLHLDPWQQLVVRMSMGVRLDGKLAAPRVGAVVPRQNGKGSILEAIELGRLFILGSPLTLHSAHLFKTSKEAYLRVRRLVQECPELHALVRRYPATNGDEGIILKKGPRLHFVARSGGSGRGLTSDCLILDEAMYLPQHVMAAVSPSISARPYGQIWYTGSAVDQLTMPDGLPLARIRQQAIEGTNKRLAYFEWSLDYDTPDDVPESLFKEPAEFLEATAASNPAFGVRIELETVENEAADLGPRGLAVERWNVGDWPALEGAESAISLDKWRALVDERSEMLDPVVFALDVSPDRSRAAISAAGKRSDGLWHVETVATGRGTGWIPARLKELIETHQPGAVICDSKGPAASLVPELGQEGVEITKMTTDEHVQACGFLLDAVDQAKLRHRGGQELVSAIRGASKRPLGDAFAWSRKNSSVDITPLCAATFAVWGASTLEAPPLVAFSFA